MRDELEKLVAAGKIQKSHIAPLLSLKEAGFCHHKSWGFGRIVSVDLALGRLNIDFTNKAGHSMDLAFSAESLKLLPQSTRLSFNSVRNLNDSPKIFGSTRTAGLEGGLNS